MKKIRYLLRDIKYGISNIIYFLPLVWKFRPWDSEYNKDLLVKSLRLTSKHLRENGYAVDSEQNADEIDRACDILNKDFLDFMPNNKDLESKLLDEDTGLYEISFEKDERRDRVFNKMKTWNKAKISTLGKLFKNYENWWD